MKSSGELRAEWIVKTARRAYVDDHPGWDGEWEAISTDEQIKYVRFARKAYWVREICIAVLIFCSVMLAAWVFGIWE